MQRRRLSKYVERRLQVSLAQRRADLNLTPYQSNFVFRLEDGVRTFQHRLQMNGTAYDCIFCGSSCAATDPYSLHWDAPMEKNLYIQEHDQKQEQRKPTYLIAHQGTTPGATERWQLHFIRKNKVEQFFICNAVENQEFLTDAGSYAVPHLLRLLFHTCDELHVRLGLQVRVRNRKDLLFQSSELPVRHYFDVTESVDVLLIMLLQEIEIMVKNCDNYSIRRLHIQVRRVQRADKAEVPCVLPLQYSLKLGTYERGAVTAQQFYALSPETRAKLNLYGFRECPGTQQLYVMPYQYGRRSTSDSNTTSDEIQATTSSDSAFAPGTNFIMICNVAGQLQHLLPVLNIRHFRSLDDGSDGQIHRCKECFATFGQRIKVVLHEMLGCGRGFEVLTVADDRGKTLQRTVSMKCKEFPWELYAIIP